MKLKLIVAALVFVAATLVSPSLATAQEGEPVLVDEVIAQVGDGIITLSQLKKKYLKAAQRFDKCFCASQAAAELKRSYTVAAAIARKKTRSNLLEALAKECLRRSRRAETLKHRKNQATAVVDFTTVSPCLCGRGT